MRRQGAVLLTEVEVVSDKTLGVRKRMTCMTGLTHLFVRTGLSIFTLFLQRKESES